MRSPSVPPVAPRRASIGLLSTYPPTQCGLATFTAALAEQLPTAGVVRVVDTPESHQGDEVVAHLVTDSPASTADAAARLNRFDVVVLQHEYGIYGGPAGRDVLEVTGGLTVPLVVVFHTVLVEPTLRQRRILQRLLAVADVGVTMTETARQRLIDHYGADPELVTVIPHGAVDHGTARPSLQRDGRPIVLTWGLLGPGKGIEWAVDALPELRDLDPRYLVIGRTHPKVLAAHGESYRRRLERQVAQLGVADLVELDDSYLSVDGLAELVERADVVLLPYDSREQVTSGVLIEAVAAGRPVVSTSFPHAVELLGDGTGIVVPQRDPEAIAAALRRVLSEPGLATDMAARAARKAPDLHWSSVGVRYQQLADALVAAAFEAAS
jgi:glycosyltransferase involved in cell wall biosynthesis